MSLWQGDITTLRVDAIVNAARPSLLGGGGIDRAIHIGAGPNLLAECRTLGGCVHGEAKITRAYQLPCQHVIHTVGPHRDLHTESDGDAILQRSYCNCLDLAVRNQVHTIALPCTGTGAYRWPNRHAAHVALKCVREWLEQHPTSLRLVIFNVFLDLDAAIYHDLMPLYFPI